MVLQRAVGTYRIRCTIFDIHNLDFATINLKFLEYGGEVSVIRINITKCRNHLEMNKYNTITKIVFKCFRLTTAAYHAMHITLDFHTKYSLIQR